MDCCIKSCVFINPSIEWTNLSTMNMSSTKNNGILLLFVLSVIMIGMILYGLDNHLMNSNFEIKHKGHPLFLQRIEKHDTFIFYSTKYTVQDKRRHFNDILTRVLVHKNDMPKMSISPCYWMCENTSSMKTTQETNTKFQTYSWL